MTTLNLTKTPIGVPQELHSAFSDIYNALWALQAGQTEGSGNQVSLVQGIGISIRVDGNSYIISNSGVARVVTIGNGYELLAPASDAGTYNLLSLLAGDNIKMDLDKESGLTISAVLEKVNWSAIVDAPATYPPEVHAHALTDVTLYRRGSSSFKSAADYFDFVESSCLVTGGAITLNSDCTVSVAAGTCLVRETADNSGHLYIYDFPAATLAAIAAGTTKRIVVAQTTVVNGDGSVTRSVTAQLADIANESNTLTLAVVSNVNGTLHFIAQYPGAAKLLRSIIARESAIAPVALEASSGFKLTTGVSRTLQVEAGAAWAGMFRYPHALRDSAVKPITEVYGAHFGVTLSSWPNAKYYSVGADNLQDLAAGTYGCLWIYSSIDTDDWFVAYGSAQYATASLAASAPFPSYLTQQFKNTTFFLGRLIFLANADSPFDLETAQNFGVTGTVAKFADLVNSYASLVNGKVPESQLPSYVDDVLEFDDNTKFPATGERGKIYVDCLNNATYRWTGTTYVKIGDGSSSALASTDALPEGTVNKYYLDSRARAALSASGSLAYNPTTGVFSYTPPASEPPLAAGTSSQYYRGDKTWQTLNKKAVGLNNVDNTADANKSVSYAATAGSAPASDVSSWAKAATKPAYTAAEVGLGNVNNTSDADKPVSNATAAALSGKEPTIVAGTAAQYWAGNKSWTDFATSARAVVLTGLSTATNAVIVATDSVLSAFGKLQKQVSDNLTALITHTTSTSNPHGVTKAQVGLGNVDNTADINKPISTAMQTALDAKENNITAGATSQYYRGDKTWQTLDKTAVGLGNVDNKSSAAIRGEITKADISNSLGGAAPVVFTVAAAGYSTYWVNLGTYTAEQLGNTIKFDIIGHNGYNSTIVQDFISTIFFKTSNGTSADGNGFYGDGYYYTFGPGTSILGAKIVANTTQPSISFDVYVLFAAYADNSIVAVSCPADTSFTIKNIIATDPGAASATVCVLQPYDVKLNNKSIIVDGKYNTLAGYGITDVSWDTLVGSQPRFILDGNNKYIMRFALASDIYSSYVDWRKWTGSNNDYYWIQIKNAGSNIDINCGVNCAATDYGTPPASFDTKFRFNLWEGRFSIYEGYTNGGGQLQLVDKIGNSKTLRCLNNQFSMTNSANTANVLEVDDAGNVKNHGWLTSAQGLFAGDDQTNGFLPGGQDNATWTANNLKIQSWFGIGFACSCAGMPTSGQYSHVFNTRNGDIWAYGQIIAAGDLSAGAAGTGTDGTRKVHLINSYGDTFWYLLTNGDFGFQDSKTGTNRFALDADGTARFINTVVIGAGAGQAAGIDVSSTETPEWKSRIISRNATNDRAAFLGQYYGRPGVFVHNNTLDAFGVQHTLWLNTLGQYGHASVYLPEETYTVTSGTDNLNLILSTKNFSNYTCDLTNGVCPDVTGSDLNVLTKAGFYRGFNLTNAPTAGWYFILVQGHDNRGTAEGWCSQNLVGFGIGGSTPNTIQQRAKTGINWTGWTNFITTDNVANYSAIAADGYSRQIQNIDLNTINSSGFYKGYGLTNAPGGNTGWFFVIVQGHDGNWTTQTAISYGSGNAANQIYTRTKSEGTWSSWAEQITTNNIAAQVAANLPAQSGGGSGGGSVARDLAKVYISGSANVHGDSTWKAVPFNTTLYDTNTLWDATNKRFVPKKAGYYQFNMRVRTDSPAAIAVAVVVNGAAGWNAGTSSTIGSDSTLIACGGTCTLYCNGTTDYVELWLWSNTSRTYTTGFFDTWFEIVGPQ